MSTTLKTRKTVSKRKSKTAKRLALPDSTKTIELGGETYCITPATDMQDWLEDIEDIIDSQKAMEEPGESIAFDDVVKKLGIKLPKRGR